MVETKTNFDTIVAQHEELHGLTNQLREYLESPRPEMGKKGSHTWAAEMSTRLMTLHDKLFRHFREEEACGFLEQLQQDCPTAIHVLEGLKDDHGRLLEELRDLVASALTYGEGKETDQPWLRRRARALLDALAEHEQKETDLLQRSYSEDFGYGD